MATMKKLILLFSIVAVSFALQADDSTAPKEKAACCAAKTAATAKCADKAAACPAMAKAKGSACCAAKGSCPVKLAKARTAKKLQSPKAAGE